MQHRIVSRRLQAIVAEGEATLVAYNYREKCKTAIPEEVHRRIREIEGQMNHAAHQ